MEEFGVERNAAGILHLQMDRPGAKLLSNDQLMEQEDIGTNWDTAWNMFQHAHDILYKYVPHMAAADVSKIANDRRLVAVNHGSQSRSTDGSKSGWRQRSVGVVVVVIVVAM